MLLQTRNCRSLILRGAVLFEEAGNKEVERYFADGEEYVSYTDATPEERIAH